MSGLIFFLGWVCFDCLGLWGFQHDWFCASRDTPLPLGGLCYALNGRLYASLPPHLKMSRTTSQLTASHGQELGGPSEPLRKYATYKIKSNQTLGSL